MATAAGLAAAFQELGIAHRRRCGQGSAAAIIHTLRGRRAQVGPLLVLFLRTLHNLAPYLSKQLVPTSLLHAALDFLANRK